MKSKILVLADSPSVMGFRLAGLQDTLTVDAQSFQTELEKSLTNPAYGIIIVNEEMLSKISWRLKKKLDSIAYPVIVPLPDRTGKSTEGDELRNLIKRALGFDLGAKK
ncbi:V-type ATP synthase subunit F [Candidatus Micrarchaeota archaeon]|nr:V-type ATP synthase subunit F [Candidatus Micrarchaeota archaeon]